MEVKLINAYPALLVLDLQELFSSTDGSYKNDAANLINNVNLLSRLNEVDNFK